MPIPDTLVTLVQEFVVRDVVLLNVCVDAGKRPGEEGV
jgi:hypothetical protein